MTTSSAGMEARKAATKQKPKPKRQTSPHKASTLAEPPYTSPLLLTVEESAQKLRICRDFVYRLLARGEIHSVKIGRARRIPLRELEAYIERLSAA